MHRWINDWYKDSEEAKVWWRDTKVNNLRIKLDNNSIKILREHMLELEEFKTVDEALDFEDKVRDVQLYYSQGESENDYKMHSIIADIGDEIVRQIDAWEWQE